MGIYLDIKAKKATDKEAKRLNKTWQAFSNEDEEKNYRENFYGDKNGYTLHFITDENNRKKGVYFRDKQGLAVGHRNALGEKEACRTDLGFRPDMTDDEAKKQYMKAFSGTGWSQLASCQIKLSGGHYCYHSLRKVIKFLEKNKKSLTWSDEGEPRGKNLRQYADPKRWGIKIISSRYCKKCKEQADNNGILIPLLEKEGCKNIMYTDPYNKAMEQALAIPD